MADFSPMMRQYLAVKADHPDEILFFRIGDFYEMFFDDAKTVSRELDLTLTGKSCGQEERAPMCGVPFHSVEGYLARLIQKGHKVAICEQTEDPAAAKGLVKRQIVRVVTPGTVIEQQLLDEGANNFLAALWPEEDRCGLCVGDITTGTLRMTELSAFAAALTDELAAYAPSELVVPEAFLDNPCVHTLRDKLNATVSVYPAFDTKDDPALSARFPAEAKALERYPLGKKALAGLLAYLKDTQKTDSSRFAHVQIYEPDSCLRMGATERGQLELVANSRTGGKKGSLFGVLDQTKTGMGRRYLRQAIERPLMDPVQINKRLDAVAELTENSIQRMELTASLEGIYDLERMLTRILYNSATPRELKSLELAANKLPAFQMQLKRLKAPLFCELAASFDPLDDLKELVGNALVDNPPLTMKDGGVFRDGYAPELDELRDILKNGRAYLARIETEEKEKTGIHNLKIAYNRVFGYYLEVSKSNLAMVPDYYIRKQTLTTGERYITEELKELENKILSAGERQIKLETELFSALKAKISKETGRIEAAARAVQRADFLCALANVAAENHYCRPEISEDCVISVTEGRHPVVEQNKEILFVANDVKMDCRENQLLMITGPNMAGKSTYMRQVALTVILAQMGSFVPAATAKIGLCDQIFTRIGASDDLNGGASTFMVEMQEMANILNHATKRSLILLDEVGRGTSTFDGMSIARAAAIYLVKNENVKARTLFATHYHELCSLEDEYEGVVNYNCAAKKRHDSVIFLRKIVRGGTDDSFGIEVAKLAGVPAPVITLAKKILTQLESGDVQTTLPFSVSSGAGEADEAQQEVLEALLETDVSTLTPLEAMNLLFELQKKLKSGKDEA